MNDIALISPDLFTFETAREIITKNSLPVLPSVGLSDEGVARAANFVQQGIDVIISRGETGRSIRNAFPEATVVFIKRSGLDIARSLGRAMRHPGPIAAVSYTPDPLEYIVAVCDALNIPIRPYALPARNRSEEMVLKAVREGARVIIGTATILEPAHRHSIPYEPILSSEETLQEAIREALTIRRVRQQDKARSSLLRTVLDATDNGIVAVDASGRITVFNSVAERQTGRNADQAVGKTLSGILPELDIERTIRTGEEELYSLVGSGEKNLICTITPVKVEGAVDGAVCTLEDVTKVQAMEATVRRRIYASGHIAATRFHDIQGKGEALQKAIAKAKEYAHSEETVLLTGETGTGKELFAQSIHNQSPRAKGPFVAVNCAALPGQLLESELFGYMAGAFTGASSKGKVGLFELARGGSIFLDEITEMERGVQAKMLRVLQEKKVMRVGGDQMTPIDVRIIAATNKNLRGLAKNGDFRQDLYFRLNVLLLHLPPLRERQEDIPLLCEYFLKTKLPASQTRPILGAGAMAALKAHAWPGNIRELHNLIVRLAATAHGKTVDSDAIRELLGAEGEEKTDSPLAGERREDFLQALRLTGGRRGEAAKMLGVSRSTLWRKMLAWRIAP
jgi:PAS domain S-box-containing protein